MLQLFDRIKDIIKNTGRLDRHSVPVLIFLILASLSLWIYYTQSTREKASIQHIINEDSARLQYTVGLHLNERLSALQRMAARWSAANGTPKEVWQTDAKNYIGTLPGLKILAWMDSTYRIQWEMPPQENQKKLGSNGLLNSTLKSMLTATIKRNEQTVTPPYKLPQGYNGFIYLSPVKSNGFFDGFLVGVFNIKDFFTDALSYYSNQHYNLTLSYQGTTYFNTKTGKSSKTSEWITHKKIKLFDKQWDLTIEPNKEIIELYKSFFPLSLLISGLVISFLATFVISDLLASESRAQYLAKTNELINIILQSTQHLIIATDKNGLVTLFNKSSEKALGYSAEEIIGKKTPAIWHDSEEVIARAAALTEELKAPISPGFEAFVAKAQRDIIETVEWTLIRKNGSRFPARLTATALRDGRQIIGYLGVLEDISEYKNAANEVREIKSAMENAVEGIGKLNVSGCYIYLNESYAKMVGYKPEELIGKQWATTVHPDDQAFMKAEYERMLKVGKVSPEVRGVRKDGTIFEKQLTMISNIDTQGNFVGHFCFMKDITERKESERKTALLAAIVESSEDPMVSENLDGIITAWNKSAENLFGYSASEAIGKNILLLFPPDKLVEEEMIMNTILKGNAIKQMETIRISKNGQPIHVSVTASPITDKYGNIIGCSKVIRDITKRKQQEKDLELLTDKLLESNTQLERFAYIASHDLQEPIRMITNFSEILAKDYENLLDDDGKEYLKIVINAGVRMRDMIDDLLSYSRLTNDSQRMVVFKGESIMREVQENIKSLLDEKKVKLSHDKLPELCGNPVQILRLLQNLIVNGIKYQPTNNIPEIHVSVEETTEHWRISVQDNGLGIKPEYLEVIFQPFKRLHTWDSISGTGLGLAICKKIAENHGGTIQVKSELGKGSTFYFYISKKLKQIGN